jgi:hypothetical protein
MERTFKRNIINALHSYSRASFSSKKIVIIFLSFQFCLSSCLGDRVKNKTEWSAELKTDERENLELLKQFLKTYHFKELVFSDTVLTTNYLDSISSINGSVKIDQSVVSKFGVNLEGNIYTGVYFLNDSNIFVLFNVQTEYDISYNLYVFSNLTGAIEYNSFNLINSNDTCVSNSFAIFKGENELIRYHCEAFGFQQTSYGSLAIVNGYSENIIFSSQKKIETSKIILMSQDTLKSVGLEPLIFPDIFIKRFNLTKSTR